MANPVIVSCAKDAWTIVAANVTTGVVNLQDRPRGGVFRTYRATGGAAPTDLTDATPFSWDGFPIESSFAVDVYVWAGIAAGSVKVSI